MSAGPPPKPPSLVGEFVFFLRERKKWWLVPMVGLFLVFVALVFFGSSPLSTFIYTLF